MRPINRMLLPALLSSSVVCATGAAAFDLNGTWANDPAVCDKIFVKKKNRISMTRDSDMYGSGFIAEGNKIRGKMASCAVKEKKEEAGIVNMVAVCSTDIALQNVQFMLKIDGDDKVTRLYEGLPELSVSYVRCAPLADRK